MPVRTNTAGCVAAFAQALVARTIEFSIGVRVNEHVSAAIGAAPKDAWRGPSTARGEAHHRGEVAELDVSIPGWPPGTRAICEGEQPHPDGQLRLWGTDGATRSPLPTPSATRWSSSCASAATPGWRTLSRRCGDTGLDRMPFSGLAPPSPGWSSCLAALTAGVIAPVALDGELAGTTENAALPAVARHSGIIRRARQVVSARTRRPDDGDTTPDKDRSPGRRACDASGPPRPTRGRAHDRPPRRRGARAWVGRPDGNRPAPRFPGAAHHQARRSPSSRAHGIATERPAGPRRHRRGDPTGPTWRSLDAARGHSARVAFPSTSINLTAISLRASPRRAASARAAPARSPRSAERLPPERPGSSTSRGSPTAKDLDTKGLTTMKRHLHTPSGSRESSGSRLTSRHCHCPGHRVSLRTAPSSSPSCCEKKKRRNLSS